MPGEGRDERTEAPTPRRREEARQKGNVAKSSDLVAAGHMVAATAVMYLLGPSLWTSSGEFLSTSLSAATWTRLDQDTVVRIYADVLQWCAAAVLPFLVFMAVASVFVNVVQVGFLVTPQALLPKASRLNPISGLGRLISIRAFAKLLTSLAKLFVLTVLSIWFVSRALPGFVPLLQASPPETAAAIGESIAWLAFQLSVALLVLSLADLGYQRWNHEQDLRMTKQEVRDEFKEIDGDPYMKQRRREAHEKVLESQNVQRTPESDVVLTNPTHVSVAVKYDPETMPAPIVVAKGLDEVALRIRRIAAEHGIPIIERPELARSLHKSVKLGQQIPVEMYEAFVEIMAYVYRITGKRLPK